MVSRPFRTVCEATSDKGSSDLSSFGVTRENTTSHGISVWKNLIDFAIFQLSCLFFQQLRLVVVPQVLSVLL